MIKSPGNKIKKIRELRSFTQEYMAEKINLSTRAYSKIESGETELTIKRLNEISEILEVKPEEILGFDEKQIFNNCNQKGNIGINHNYFPQSLIEFYEEKIKKLEEELSFFKK